MQNCVRVRFGRLALALCVSLHAICGQALADAGTPGTHARAEAPSAPAGPSPYPKDPAQWPGKGAIRVFDWMWQKRHRDRLPRLEAGTRDAIRRVDPRRTGGLAVEGREAARRLPSAAGRRRT